MYKCQTVKASDSEIEDKTAKLLHENGMLTSDKNMPGCKKVCHQDPRKVMQH
jgi:hypothetical protein